MSQKLETFTRKTKNELVLSAYATDEKKAILSGFVRYSGTVSIAPNLELRLSSSSAAVSKFIFQCFKEVYQVQPKMSFTKQLRLYKSVVYHITVSEKVNEILKDLQIMEDFQEIVTGKEYLNERAFHYFMIGTFLASGQISDPASGRYFCEVVFNDEDEADIVLKKLSAFKNENTMGFKKIKRRNKFVLYLKKSDQISVFLSYLGAVSMMFSFENTRMQRDMFNLDNRNINCEQANYERALKNGEENIRDIQILQKRIGEVYFTEKTRLIAQLREKNKDASYGRLAELAAEEGLIITKSGVAHIFDRFHKDATLGQEAGNEEEKA